MTLSDETLNAYHDRALPPAEMQRIAALVTADPVLSDRLAQLAAVDALVRPRFAAVLEAPLPLAVVRAITADPSPPPAPRAAPPAWRQAAAAALLGAALGAGGMFWAAPRLVPATPSPDWVAQVADYHRVYAAEDRHLVEVDATQTAHIETWLGARIGRPFRVPDLAAHGLTFRGARLLVADAAPVAQLVYATAQGDVVALCLTPRPGRPDAPASARALGDLSALVWRDAGTAAVLVAPAALAGLDAIARTARLSL